MRGTNKVRLLLHLKVYTLPKDALEDCFNLACVSACGTKVRL
jgi:hypothetical protein